MNATSLIQQIGAAGGRLEIVGEDIRLVRPKGVVIPQSLLQAARDAKRVDDQRSICASLWRLKFPSQWRSRTRRQTARAAGGPRRTTDEFGLANVGWSAPAGQVEKATPEQQRIALKARVARTEDQSRKFLG
jgi:hypothetical protein